MTQRNVLPIASVRHGGYNRPVELPHLETFPGAACLATHRACQATKRLSSRRLGPLNALRVCNNLKLKRITYNRYPILNCRCSRQSTNTKKIPVNALIMIELNKKMLMVWPKISLSGPKNTLRCFDV